MEMKGEKMSKEMIPISENQNDYLLGNFNSNVIV
jgi:hypothetical protein